MKINPLALREKSGLNQTDFWDRIGITQSGGSRYETGERKVPKPVQHLLRLIYVEKLDLDRVRKGDVDMASYLKVVKPQLYKQLRREAAAWVKEVK